MQEEDRGTRGRPASAGSNSSDELFPELYEELRLVAGRHLRREAQGHSLEPAALVHEVFVKLSARGRIRIEGRTHFLNQASQEMRRILVDHARKQNRLKRGDGRKPVTLSTSVALCGKANIDLCALDDALERLESYDARAARIVELMFFGGLKQSDTAKSLGISVRQVQDDWSHARAWLRHDLEKTG